MKKYQYRKEEGDKCNHIKPKRMVTNAITSNQKEWWWSFLMEDLEWMVMRKHVFSKPLKDAPTIIWIYVYLNDEVEQKYFYDILHNE